MWLLVSCNVHHSTHTFFRSLIKQVPISPRFRQRKASPHRIYWRQLKLPEVPRPSSLTLRRGPINLGPAEARRAKAERDDIYIPRKIASRPIRPCPRSGIFKGEVYIRTAQDITFMAAREFEEESGYKRDSVHPARERGAVIIHLG